MPALILMYHDLARKEEGLRASPQDRGPMFSNPQLFAYKSVLWLRSDSRFESAPVGHGPCPESELYCSTLMTGM